ncbi:MAG: hypothetical protein J6T10_03655 [Methanobrevibacter sp.]|nr:hypothetical protein [Methanobrevibacter sp.]
MKTKDNIIDNLKMIKSIVEEMLDDSYQRDDDENYLAVLDRLDTTLKLVKQLNILILN